MGEIFFYATDNYFYLTMFILQLLIDFCLFCKIAESQKAENVHCPWCTTMTKMAVISMCLDIEQMMRSAVWAACPRIMRIRVLT